ncbi:MAG: TetR/AcrR family transcriptional regulator [Tissierellia bacterium]|nr:TetR/AcrR family transcriptional regulator [Tissierellia bacterium]
MKNLSKGQITRLKVLEAAKSEFATNGFKGTSLLEVAKKAGVTTGSVYCYFESKEHLYESVVDDTFEEFMAVYSRCYADQIDFIKTESREEIFGFIKKRTMDLVEFVYDHYEEILSILKAPEDTKYFTFRETIVEEGVEQFILMLKHLKNIGIGRDSIDRDEVRYQVRAEANSIFSIILEEPDKNRAMELMQKMEFFFRSGYIASHQLMV